MSTADRRLAAILFTDIVGYTALMAESEQRALRARELHREIVGPTVERYRGDPIEVRGDETLSVFPSALAAVNCALAIEAELEGEPDLRLHLGIHIGDVVSQAGEISGDGVNIASRICPLSEGGGLCVSEEVYQAVRNQPNLAATPLGEHQLKNVGRPIEVYRLAGNPISPQSTAAPIARRHLDPLFGAAVTALLVAALLAWFGVREPDQEPRIRSIAVLPLENLSGDPEQEYFVDGMTEALIGDLAKLGSLRVISRTSAMQYKGASKPLPEIAEELDVDAVVEGSVLRANDRVRITAQLIHARSDHHLWAEHYERDLRDILSLQRQLSSAIAREIQLAVAPGVGAGPVEARTVDPAAHEAYLKGRYFQMKHTPDASQKAIDYFQRSLRVDPEYAPSYAGIADTFSCSTMHFWTAPQTGFWPQLPIEVMERASAAAHRALELDPDLPAAHTSMGLVRLFGEWDWTQAERDVQRALELSPSDAFAHMVYAVLLGFLGRLDEALEQSHLALSLDPLDADAVGEHGNLLDWAGETEEARRYWRQAIELDPEYQLAYRSLGLSLCTEGRVPEALEVFEQGRAISSDDPLVLGDLGYCYATAGRPDDARRILRRIEAQAEQMFVSPVSRANIHLGLGEVDEAFLWLEEAHRVHAFWLTRIGVDPRYQRLSDDPRFDSLLRRIGLRSSDSPAMI
jgi:TolB-like protein/class 3 adenylate cyclase/Tfp pilus assembly protein PilF